MQAEGRKKEKKRVAPPPEPAEAPAEPRRGLTEKEEERKLFLMRKRDKDYNKKLPKAELKELDELVAVEKAEHDRQALIHKLQSGADTWGRKAINQVRRDVTDRVKEFHASESTELAGIEQIYRKGRAEMDKEMRAAMQRIQEQHNKGLAALQAEHEKDAAEVRARYRGNYDEAESEIDGETTRVADLVSSFVDAIRDLELPQLQKLQAEGVLQLNGDSKGGDFIVVPGTPSKPAA